MSDLGSYARQQPDLLEQIWQTLGMKLCAQACDCVAVLPSLLLGVQRKLAPYFALVTLSDPGYSAIRSKAATGQALELLLNTLAPTRAIALR